MCQAGHSVLCIDDVLSFVVMCSVLQGLVLGLLFFILYMADLTDRATKYGVSLHAYADDTQLYLHFRNDEMASSVDQLERCVLDIGHWMKIEAQRRQDRTAVRQLRSLVGGVA